MQVLSLYVKDTEEEIIAYDRSGETLTEGLWEGEAGGTPMVSLKRRKIESGAGQSLSLIHI